MKRRNFLAAAGASLFGIHAPAISAQGNGIVMTVNGPISPEKIGVTLTHEHVLVDFIGAEQVNPDRYDAEEAFKVILPYLRQVRNLGCQSFIECTPAYIGRDVKLLQRLSQAAGMHILTNTGYYGAANDKFVPKHAYEESAGQLAERWLDEWREGIEETGIRPGFIKIGVDSGPLSDIDAKLARAAALACKQSGLPIASHTGDTRAGLEQVEILQEEGVDPTSFIWVHAQNDWQLMRRIESAVMGVWISIDNVNTNNSDAIIKKIMDMKAAGCLNKILLSHDAGWYSPGEPNGGDFRAFDALFTNLIPSMKETGFTQQEIDQLLIHNPQHAFTIDAKTSGL
ncbi:MAG: phosphotriesterase [Candidatus Omnitrophica bacterium]|nr:phosphotriesterase [Candidatus Omnitrophota bacterium]